MTVLNTLLEEITPEQQTTTDAQAEFQDYIYRESVAAKERGYMTDWQLYEYLKSKIDYFDVEYETAIKIITEISEV